MRAFSSVLPLICLLWASTALAQEVTPAAATVRQIEANKLLVRRLFAAIEAGDLATLNAISDPKYVDHGPTGDRPHNGPSKELKDACPLCTHLNPRKVTIELMLAEGDLVAVRSTFSGRYSGVIRNVPISGKDVVLHYSNIYRIREGRIVDNWASSDRLGQLEELGFGVTAPATSPAKP